MKERMKRIIKKDINMRKSKDLENSKNLEDGIENKTKINDDDEKLMTPKDYVALAVALFSIFLPWALIFGLIYALVIFILTKFWLGA